MKEKKGQGDEEGRPVDYETATDLEQRSRSRSPAAVAPPLAGRLTIIFSSCFFSSPTLVSLEPPEAWGVPTQGRRSRLCREGSPTVACELVYPGWLASGWRSPALNGKPPVLQNRGPPVAHKKHAHWVGGAVRGRAMWAFLSALVVGDDLL